jgi:predicted SprT family Zn-dependent metalloprotease
MELEESIIKNTIIHELIHCIPFCNNHGTMFKQYANLINSKCGYDIARTGNKKKDFEKSNIEFNEIKHYKYRIVCKKCKQEFYRKRISRNFSRKYRCAKCGSKFEINFI